MRYNIVPLYGTGKIDYTIHPASMLASCHLDGIAVDPNQRTIWSKDVPLVLDNVRVTMTVTFRPV